MDSTFLDYALLAITFGSGFIIISYEDYSRMRGWPIGELLSSDHSTIKLLAAFNMLQSTVFPFFALHWLSPLLVVALGFGLAVIVTQLLKYWVQLPATLTAISSFILCPVWIYF